MPRWDSFGRSLAFAALAAAGLPVAVTFAGFVLGGEGAARLYLIGAASIYAIGLCADRGRRVAAFAVAAFAGAILALLPLDLRATAVGAAGIVAFARGVLIAQSRTQASRSEAKPCEVRWARALAIEALLGAAGLAVAAWFARGGLLALCLALWGYFLVQSGYFLIGADAPRSGDPPRDPFEQARARLQRLLEDDRIA
jgi:hypothetical protein